MTQLNNYFYPFFWQHGEDEATLVEYVEKIYQSGMKAVCVESRPHPNFVEDKWWIDLQIIIRECKKREMKIWILDDSHFPTGFANGKIRDEHPELKKQYLTMRRFDVVGPFEGARIDASMLKGRPWETHQIEVIEVIGVYLVERDSAYNQDGDPLRMETVIDITTCYKEDTIYVDVPKGNWSVLVVFSTHEGGEEMTEDYLNPIVAEATQVLLDEVYEKHYQNVGEYFGNVITAFFSDEPRFGNEKGCESSIGKFDMNLPWRPGLERELPFDSTYLPLLWVPGTHEEHREVRFSYMDVITRLYNENFTKVLADWCQDKGLIYLGHNIEDNGAHARLGYGAGHFFRAQEAQHFSGVDTIGGQIVPGMPYHHDAFQTGGSDGQFYHFALAKLGSSAAHLTPHKKGRAMCEAYGAYGWNEGLKTMKWITDHLLVRGINYIVPHAFSPKEYPDWDCPPHFYAHGHNPQYRYMTKLTNYANRVMDILNGGIHRAPVAVLYPAEFEWAGNYMPVEIPVRTLTESQIDMDIVSVDHLESASIDAGRLKIGDEYFEILIVPYAEYVPKKVMNILNHILDQGVRVAFVDGLPINQDELRSEAEVIMLEELSSSISMLAEIRSSSIQKELVYYHYEKGGKDYWFFFNESMGESIDTTISFTKQKGIPLAYDVYNDKKFSVVNNHEGYQLKLAPYQTVMWVFDAETNEELSTEVTNVETIVIKSNWLVSFAKPKEYPNFESITKIDTIKPLNTFEGYDRLGGTVAYETTLEVEHAETIIGLDLGRAYEVAEVFINNQSVDVKIAPPYRYDIQGLLKKGNNKLRIEVTNTLGTEFRGGLSQYLLVEPLGLMDEVQLYRSK